jgi:sortase B
MRIKTVIEIAVLVVAIGVFGFSGYKIYSYVKEAEEESAVVNMLSDNAVRIYDNTQTQQTQDNDTTDIQSEIKPQLELGIDFDYLREENEDIKAWIYSPDTPINYPILQSDDNDYYLHRLADKTYNSAGSLFIDCRNSSDFSDYITIIYGHNMKNNSMFGSIDNYKKQSYYDEHPVLYIALPDKSYTIKLIAGFVVSASSDFYTPPQDLQTRNEYIEEMLKISTFDADANISDISDDDRLVMLSTCSYEYDKARYVLVGIMK